jgi:hypothetical protein
VKKLLRASISRKKTSKVLYNSSKWKKLCSFGVFEVVQIARFTLIELCRLTQQPSLTFCRWQQVWLVAIVPPKRWGKMDRNDCHTAWGNLKTIIYSLRHYNNYAWVFSLLGFFKKLLLLLLSFRLSIAIYRLQVTTFSTLA